MFKDESNENAVNSQLMDIKNKINKKKTSSLAIKV